MSTDAAVVVHVDKIWFGSVVKQEAQDDSPSRSTHSR